MIIISINYYIIINQPTEVGGWAAPSGGHMKI